MANPISALELRPFHVIREVSMDALNFYANELSGIYLPDDFKNANGDVSDVKYWKPEDRLRGKFGRFTLRHAEENGQDELDDILLIGTTIGLSGLDRYRDMYSLRHFEFQDKIHDVLEVRDLVGTPVKIDRADYGGTSVMLDENGNPLTIKVGGRSIDFGRANTEGRQQTCEMFEQLLGCAVEVINSDPDPRDYDQIIE